MNEILWNANIYAHTFEINVSLSHHCIYFGVKERAAVISYIKLIISNRHICMQRLYNHATSPRHWFASTQLLPVAASSTVQPAAALLQPLLFGRSSVREWTRLWLFGIPWRSTVRDEASLKDTFPLLCVLPIQSVWHGCGVRVSASPVMFVIDFQISYPSIMHLAPWGKKHPQSSSPLLGGRRQDDAVTGQRDVLLPGYRSLDSLACITSRHKLLQDREYITDLQFRNRCCFTQT